MLATPVQAVAARFVHVLCLGAMAQPETQADAPNKPFQITHIRREVKPGVSFVPGAMVQITPGLRASGLLLALPAEELRSLLLILTFVHPNGHIQPSLLELAQALRLSQGATRTRMRRLERFLWQGRPLLHELRRESGLHAYSPSPRLLHVEHEPPHTPQESNAAPLARAAGREAVIAHSRATYARPRDEVEAEIARLNGWPWPFKSPAQVQEELRQKARQIQENVANAPPDKQPPDQSASSSLTLSPMNPTSTPNTMLPDPFADLRNELLTLGVPAEHVERLLASHDPDKIRQQIEWLPLRHANSPSRLLVAAIEHDYEPPVLIRQRNALEQALEATAAVEASDVRSSTPPKEETPVSDTTNLPLP